MMVVDDNHVDDNVDEAIYNCLDLRNPKSFFLFAGAGSGKTRSLVTVLKKYKKENGHILTLHNHRIAIITYTNAACEEITRRLDYDPLFSVSTIHSFVWYLIEPFQDDIREWLRVNLDKEISEIKSKLSGRDNPTERDRIRKITQKTKRLELLDSITKFSYSPSSNNFKRDSLTHTEVIKICSSFLVEKNLMRKILVRKYPILLIDESQDTNKNLMESLIKTQEYEKSNFSLGLFGDIMQRIYFDGKEDLGKNIPDDWETPIKKMNHRCPKRVVKLINQIRSSVDDKVQQARSDSDDGFVRLYLVSSSLEDKKGIEKKIASSMATVANDPKWEGDDKDVKILTLEHHMAANRMGFTNLFDPLYAVKSIKTGLLDGSLTEINFFSNIIIPLIEANHDNDNFKVQTIILDNSPLITTDKLRESKSQLEILSNINKKVKSLFKLWEDCDPVLLDILVVIKNNSLFDLPEIFIKILDQIEGEGFREEQITSDLVLSGWYNALKSKYSELFSYHKYINDEADFGTHQGVKGLEFERVLVVIDDETAGGFMFSYEKLFGAKELTKTDQENIDSGKDSSIDRTRRLFYVTCSRAEKSLAIVTYTNDIKASIIEVLDQGWLNEEEIMVLNDHDDFVNIVEAGETP